VCIPVSHGLASAFARPATKVPRVDAILAVPDAWTIGGSNRPIFARGFPDQVSATRARREPISLGISAGATAKSHPLATRGLSGGTALPTAPRGAACISGRCGGALRTRDHDAGRWLIRSAAPATASDVVASLQRRRWSVLHRRGLARGNGFERERGERLTDVLREVSPLRIVDPAFERELEDGDPRLAC
jgi:hypothetical protein